MERAPRTGATEMLVEAVRMQVHTRQRLRELQALPRPSDDERDEAWTLLRTVRTLAAQARQLRAEISRVRLGA